MKRRPIHEELLEADARRAPESESVDELSKRVARPVGLAITLAGVAVLVLFAIEFLGAGSGTWGLVALYIVVTVAWEVWDSRDRIREWWKNQR